MSIEAGVVAPLVVSGVLYAEGTRRAWQRAGAGRGVSLSRAACFALGLASVALALIGPLDELGETLFSGHMAQHLVLMNLAAPLLVLGSPIPTFLRAMPAAPRGVLVRIAHSRAWRTAWSAASGAVVATVVQQAVLWAWHWPGAIAASLADKGVHAAMHASLLGSALLFWTMVLGPGKANRWRGMVALVATAKATGIVCIVMLVQDRSYFDVYGSGPRGAGLDAVTDEHLGWGLMMVGAGTAYVVAAAWRFYRTLEPRVRRRTRIFIAARTTASSAAPTRSLARPGLMSRNAAATSTTRSQARASPTR